MYSTQRWEWYINNWHLAKDNYIQNKLGYNYKLYNNLIKD